MVVAMDEDAADILPNQTLYINNLNERGLKKEEMKKALHAIFSEFGRVLDVVVMATFRLRGQAWVVMENVSVATTAMKRLQGFPLFEKEMRIAYAKTKSDAVAKLEGTFVPRDKSAVSAHNKAEREKLEGRKKRQREEQEEEEAAATAAAAAQVPHTILFVEDLPKEATEIMVATLFQQFPGYKEVRMVPSKPGIAFVEFENEMQSGVAMQGLQGFKITKENAILITFAKK